MKNELRRFKRDIIVWSIGAAMLAQLLPGLLKKFGL